MRKAFLLVSALLALSKPVMSETINSMSVADFILDKDEIKVGKMVTVFGSPACLSGELCYLYSGDGLLNYVSFDPKALPREDRKTLLGCNPLANPCYAAITGAKSNGLLNQINATKVSFTNSMRTNEH